MSERSPDLFPLLEPPPGGWNRLRARRDSEPGRTRLLVLAASIAGVALGVVLAGAYRPALTLPPSGARLVDAGATGQPIRFRDTPRTSITPLRSGNDNVQLYWAEPVAQDRSGG